MGLRSLSMDKKSGQSAWCAMMAHFQEGYVISIGTFLQQYYIYGVEFLESGFRVGMKRKELESVELLVAGGRA